MTKRRKIHTRVVQTLNITLVALIIGQLILGNYSVVFWIYFVVLVLNLVASFHTFIINKKKTGKVVDEIFDDNVGGTADFFQNKYGDIIVLITIVITTFFWPLGALISPFINANPKYVNMLDEKDEEEKDENI